jgi:hypothetical protein
MFWRGAFESLFVISGFVGLGLGWGALERRDAAVADYPSAPMESAPPEPTLWLVDGFNVLHAGVLRGRDRAEWWSARRRGELVALAERFEDEAAEIWIVFDGKGPAEPAVVPSGRVRQVFAPSADDWLLATVRESAAPGCLAVVTADRAVAARARHRGAQVVGPRSVLARCRPAQAGSGGAM